jgi:hypothetical protein
MAKNRTKTQLKKLGSPKAIFLESAATGVRRP